jgi:hypothetical protein
LLSSQKAISGHPIIPEFKAAMGLRNNNRLFLATICSMGMVTRCRHLSQSLDNPAPSSASDGQAPQLPHQRVPDPPPSQL